MITKINICGQPDSHHALVKYGIMADGEDSGAKIKVVVKTPKEKKDIELESTGTVKEVVYCMNNS